MSVGGDSLPLPGVTTFTAMARRSAKPVVDTVARLTPDDNALLNRVRTGVARGVSGMKRSSTLTDLPSANTRRGGESEVSGASNGFGHDESGVVSGPWAGPGVLPTIWNFAHMPPMPATPPMPLIPAADKTPTTPKFDVFRSLKTDGGGGGSGKSSTGGGGVSEGRATGKFGVRQYWQPQPRRRATTADTSRAATGNSADTSLDVTNATCDAVGAGVGPLSSPLGSLRKNIEHIEQRIEKRLTSARASSEWLSEMHDAGEKAVQEWLATARFNFRNSGEWEGSFGDLRETFGATSGTSGGSSDGASGGFEPALEAPGRRFTFSPKVSTLNPTYTPNPKSLTLNPQP